MVLVQIRCRIGAGVASGNQSNQSLSSRRDRTNVGTRLSIGALSSGASGVIMFTGLRRARPDQAEEGDAVRRELPGSDDLIGRLPDGSQPLVGVLAAGAAR
jgi:hypothetical protein